MKKFICVLLAGLTMLLACTNVSAAVPETMLPQWTNTSYIIHELAFDGTDGSVNVSVAGKYGTTKIIGYVIVYKEVDGEWVYVTSESAGSITQSLSLSVEFQAEEGVYYRSALTTKVTCNGTVEEITNNKYKTC